MTEAADSPASAIQGDAAGVGWGWAFIDLAALGRNTPRSYVFTLLRVILLPLAFIAVAFAAIYAGAWYHLLKASSEPFVVIGAAFGSVVVAGIALGWGVVRSHRRPWMSLISTDLRLDWRRLAIGAGVEGVLLLGFIGVGHLASGEPWDIGSSLPLPALAVVMLLVPFQAATEEMLFRGYLTQAFGRVVRNRAVIAAAVAIVFGLLHLNAYGALTAPYLGVLSLIYSMVSLRDQRIELTIGAHAATNWLAIGAGDVLDAASRGSIALDWTAILALAANGVLFYAITRVLVRLLCCERRPAP